MQNAHNRQWYYISPKIGVGVSAPGARSRKVFGEGQIIGIAAPELILLERRAIDADQFQIRMFSV